MSVSGAGRQIARIFFHLYDCILLILDITRLTCRVYDSLRFSYNTWQSSNSTRAQSSTPAAAARSESAASREREPEGAEDPPWHPPSTLRGRRGGKRWYVVTAVRENENRPAIYFADWYGLQRVLGTRITAKGFDDQVEALREWHRRCPNTRSSFRRLSEDGRLSP